VRRLLKHCVVSPETTEVAHTVFISAVAIFILALAMAFEGWHGVSLLIALAIALVTLRIVVQVAWTVKHFRQRGDMLDQMSRQAEEHYVAILKRIVRFSEIRDGYDRNRCERVGNLCEQISRKLGLDEDRCERMNVAGWLHDIGLLAVPEQILHKASKLSGEEFRSIRKHAEASYEVLQPLTMLRGVLPAIRHHHERLNGTGYPDGLRGQEIPLGARILAVAEAYDAMTHDRPHRPAMTPLLAVRELQRCTPDGFDASCVQALAEMLNIPLLEEVMESQAPAKAPTSTPKMKVDSIPTAGV
jgi:HD-GYP domain-containing protein (c-di-GMP phosphodiesterase class II)